MKAKTPRDDLNELTFQHNVLRIRVANLEDDTHKHSEDEITSMKAAYPHVDYSEECSEPPKDDGFSDAAIANLKEADKLELQEDTKTTMKLAYLPINYGEAIDEIEQVVESVALRKEDTKTTMKLAYLPINYGGTIDETEQTVELIACRKEVAKLRAEVKRLSKRDCNATISLAYSTPDEPFASEDLTVIDVSVSDNHYIVTSDIFDKLKTVQDGSSKSEEVARLENRIYNLEANQMHNAKVTQQLRASQGYSIERITSILRKSSIAPLLVSEVLDKINATPAVKTASFLDISPDKISPKAVENLQKCKGIGNITAEAPPEGHWECEKHPDAEIVPGSSAYKCSVCRRDAKWIEPSEKSELEKDAITCMQAAYPRVDYSETIDEMENCVGLLCEFSNREDFSIIQLGLLEETQRACHKIQGEVAGKRYCEYCRPHPQTIELLALRKEVKRIKHDLDQWQEVGHWLTRKVERLEPVCDELCKEI